ncbi:MAG TPA: UDP-N-acetylmuramoyl-L-alanine--D-glutamate ligase [Blastocatellia bacterium]|nr:UDP-N-acetylmuramoyl-L-alanine--D-glutamate ligase [Blastocatellia bacterium]
MRAANRLMQIEGKKVLVVGIARSGVAAARVLVSRGAMVTANDMKLESDMAAEVDELRRLGVMLSLGGHPEALFLNADLIVVSPGVPATIEPLQKAARAGIKIISEVELAGLLLKGRLIGITGSNGKTTTTTLTGELMRAAGAQVLVGGNIGTPLTSLVDKSTDETWTVAELSSFQLETIDTTRVHVAVVTNITPDHLDRHGSFEDYMRAKHRIFLNQQGDDRAILNARDRGTRQMVASLGVGSKTIYFSSAVGEANEGPAADIYMRDGRICTTMLEGAETEVIRVSEITVPGMHNVENVMAALGAVFAAIETRAEDLQAIREAIRRFRGVEHRIEFVAEIDGVRFYNDSKATNVDSTVKALESFERNVIVILGGKDKGSDYAPLAPLVSSRVKQVVLIGAASEKIAAGLEGLRPLVRAASMEDAVLKSMESARSGDTVLLAPACASFDMFDNYEHRGRVFKEAVFRLADRFRSGWTGRLTT